MTNLTKLEIKLGNLYIITSHAQNLRTEALNAVTKDLLMKNVQ